MSDILSSLAGGAETFFNRLARLNPEIAAKQDREKRQAQLLPIFSGQTIPAFARQEQTPEQIRQAQLQQIAAVGGPESFQILSQLSPLAQTPSEIQASDLQKRKIALQEKSVGLDERKFNLEAEKFLKDLEKPLSSKEMFDRATKLRKEFTGLSKDFIVQRDSFGRIQASAESPSAAGDLALIFNYMKVLDPGSVVRESEFATAANAAGVPERIRAQYNRVLRGERLADKTRQDFLDRATKLFGRAEGQHQKRVGQYQSLAEKVGANPEEVVIDLGLADKAASQQINTQRSPADNSGAIATNPKTGEKLILRGGSWVPL